MIHRSTSSRRRKTPRPTSGSPHRSTSSLVRKSSVAFDLGADVDDKDGAREGARDGSRDSIRDNTRDGTRDSSRDSKRDKKRAEVEKLPIRGRGWSSTNLTEYASGARGGTITVTAALEDDHCISPFPSYPPEKVSDMLDNAISLNEYPKGRGSIGYESSNRPFRNSVTPDDSYGSRNLPSDSAMGRKSRSTLLPEISRSPRNSLVPEDAYHRNPRGSIDPSIFNRGSRNSLCPDPELYNRSSRPSMVADITALRNSSRNTLQPDVSPNRSPRNSLVPGDNNRSSRSSLASDINRSPRNSLVPDINRTPRGSLVAEMPSRTPRGSVTSEGSVYSYNRSSRSSLPLQDGSMLGKSPRGSIASSTGVQFDLSVKTPRGSVDSVSPGMSRISAPQRSTSPFHNSVRGKESVINATSTEITEGSRRASSNVSQVSTDDRRHLCEHTKLNPESGIHLTAYGSFVYQLNHANMESSNTLDFVFRALTIVYRTAVVTVLLVCFMMFLLIMLIMGLQFVRDCPKEPHIPVYMIVGGCFGLMKVAWILFSQVKSLRYERLNSSDTSHAGDNATTVGTKIGCFIVTTFLISWFIFGNYWILHIYWPRYHPTLYEPDNWCHKTLYVFSIVHLVIIYSILAGILVTIIVMAALQICLLRCR